MNARLYAIGVGPGDPELLTLKALRILTAVPCICVPQSRAEGDSYALSIVERVVDLNTKQVITAHFPMIKTTGLGVKSEGKRQLKDRWQSAVRTIADMLDRGVDVAFITIGDPTIYSTFFYLYRGLIEVNPSLAVEIVPGVSSINAAASRAATPLCLGDERLAILPATYTKNIQETLEKFDTIVLMKVNTVFARVVRALDRAGLADKSFFISRAGMEDEKIIRRLYDVKKEDLSYFSLVVVKK
ncbi:MAG TPA: precorrin-2 C(20)-methyltransferase [Syntrophorhabdaceae bacterium]|nr:precorrin-2 C(20)-methyltransferase [Syntrophorhabdaceae bacterium]